MRLYEEILREVADLQEEVKNSDSSSITNFYFFMLINKNERIILYMNIVLINLCHHYLKGYCALIKE